MSKKKKEGWDNTPLGEVAKENKAKPEEKSSEGPQIFEGLYHPEDNDDNPNYPANGVWR